MEREIPDDAKSFFLVLLLLGLFAALAFYAFFDAVNHIDTGETYRLCAGDCQAAQDGAGNWILYLPDGIYRVERGLELWEWSWDGSNPVNYGATAFQDNQCYQLLSTKAVRVNRGFCK